MVRPLLALRIPKKWKEPLPREYSVEHENYIHELTEAVMESVHGEGKSTGLGVICFHRERGDCQGNVSRSDNA